MNLGVSIILPAFNPTVDIIEVLNSCLRQESDIKEVLIDSMRLNYQLAAIRLEIRAYWKTHFDARTNYLKFLSELERTKVNQ